MGFREDFNNLNIPLVFQAINSGRDISSLDKYFADFDFDLALNSVKKIVLWYSQAFSSLTDGSLTSKEVSSLNSLLALLSNTIEEIKKDIKIGVIQDKGWVDESTFSSLQSLYLQCAEAASYHSRRQKPHTHIDLIIDLTRRFRKLDRYLQFANKKFNTNLRLITSRWLFDQWSKNE